MRSFRINLSPRVAAGKRIASIDELKGLAIALVALYHVGAVLGIENRIHGEIGVDIFLILSGFTLVMTSVDPPLGQYALHRILRIYPSYWIALALTLWAQRKIYGLHYSWESTWQHFVGIHGFSRLAYFSEIVDAFWFVSMILAAYVVFALIRKRLDDLSLVVAVTGFLSALAAYVYIRNSHVGGLISLAVRIPSFFVGVIAGQLLVRGTGELKFNLALGFGLICYYYQTFFLSTACNYTLPAMGIVAAWIALRSAMFKVAGGAFFLRPFALLGLISYEVYLFHQPMVRDYPSYVYAHFLNTPSPSHRQLLEGIFVGLGVTLVISTVVHLSVSRLSRFVLRMTCKPNKPAFSG